MTGEENNTLGIGEMWDFDKKTIRLQLFTRTMGDTSQSESAHTNKASSVKKGRSIFVAGEVFAYSEADIPESLKLALDRDHLLNSNSFQGLYSNPKTRLILRPRLLIRDREDGSVFAEAQQHPSLRLTVSPNIQSNGQIQTQVEIELYSMKAPFAQTDSLKQTRLIGSSADKFQIFGPLKQDGKLVFTLLKLEVRQD